MLNLKLTKAPHFLQVENNEDAERRRLEQIELLSAVDDGRYHVVKITTNILDTGKAFYIGKNAAENFLGYLDKECKAKIIQIYDYSEPNSTYTESGSAESHTASFEVKN